MLTVWAILIDGFIYASWLFLVAAGLTVIYGVMRILNMAHGSLYALGAYAAASALGWYYADGGDQLWMAFAIIAVSAILIGAVTGLIIERGLLRPHLEQTFAVSEAAAAHRHIESRHTVGKICLVFPQ